MRFGQQQEQTNKPWQRLKIDSKNKYKTKQNKRIKNKRTFN